MYKNKQKSTDLQEVNKETGLTPIQEQTAILLASGETITAVADQLSLNRGTIHKWQKQVSFKCFFNRQCADSRENLVIGLFGLANEALSTIRDCLHSDNEATRLKAAMWLTEKISNIPIGQTDVITAVKKECTHSPIDWDISKGEFDKMQYKARLKKLGIVDDELQ